MTPEQRKDHVSVLDENDEIHEVISVKRSDALHEDVQDIVDDDCMVIVLG